jgi:NTP pyrophosphatase (non-canonical NTP hydrolase)
MGKTLAEMTAEIREVNVEKGWRPADGGPGSSTFGDYIALLHSEVSEALEAYRDHRLEDATGEFGEGECTCAMSESSMASCDVHGYDAIPKPEGVGSELADVLIRLLDMCDVFGIKMFDMDMELADVANIEPRRLIPHRIETFGDHLAWVHAEISTLWLSPSPDLAAPFVLRTLVTTARKFGIDLTAEYERKIAFNRTRAFQHGGRTLADTP